MQPLPPEFLHELQGQEQVLVTSREPGRRGTVPVWFVLAPPGVVYLLTYPFSVKARRWRADPWVRLALPGTGQVAEGRAHVVTADDEVRTVAPLVVERWGMWGATTVEAVRRMVRDGQYVLVRVEGTGDGSSAARSAPPR